MTVHVLYLPLELAIEAAASQNRERDYRALGPSEVAKIPYEIYIDEANHLLVDTGENWIPDYPDHPHIKVKN